MRTDEPARKAALRIAAQQGGVRGTCIAFVFSRRFRVASALLLAISVIFMAAEANTYASHFRGHSVNMGFVLFVEPALLACFVTEFIFQCVGSPMAPWRNRQLCTDGLVVIAWIAELAVRAAVPVSEAVADIPHIVPFLVVFRLVRLWQVIRIFQVVRMLRPLYASLLCLRHSFKNFVYVSCFLGVFLLIFSWPLLDNARYCTGTLPPWVTIRFSSLDLAMASLLEFALGGTTMELNELSTSGGCPTVGAVLLAGTAALQMWILQFCEGVFVEHMWGTAERAAHTAECERLRLSEVTLQQMEKIFNEIDREGKGALTWHDFEVGICSQPDLVANLGCTLELAHVAFRHLDLDGTGIVGIDNFLIETVRVVRMSRTRDMIMLDYQQFKNARKLREIHLKWLHGTTKVKQELALFHARLGAFHEDWVPLRGVVKHGLDRIRRKREREKTATSKAVTRARAFSDAAARLPASALKIGRTFAEKRKTQKVEFDLLGTSPTGRVFAEAAKEEHTTNAVLKIQRRIRCWLARHWVSRDSEVTKLAMAATSTVQFVPDGSSPLTNPALPTLLAPLSGDRATKDGSEPQGHTASCERSGRNESRATCSARRNSQKQVQGNTQNSGRIICRRLLMPWMQLLDSEGRPRIFDDLSANAAGISPANCQTPIPVVARSAADEQVATVRLAAERWTTGFRPGARAFVMRAARPLRTSRGSHPGSDRLSNV
jgi:hypothetical protein